jgi:predicted house-cleaning noncanonical NTP pyrophosphatase (MazG superfamily)
LFNTSIIKDEELKNILSEVLSETIKKFVNIKVEEDDIED